MASMLENSSKILECPACNRIFKGKIFMCQKGHNICEGCRENTQICPTCRSNFPGARNHLVEDLVSKSLVYSCENAEHGCNVKMPIHKIGEHSKECFYRLKNCYILECSWKGHFDQLKQHIQSMHSTLLFQGFSKEILFADAYFSDETSIHNEVLFIELHDDLFAYFYKRGRKENLQFSVIHLGPKGKERNFHFKLAFQNEDRSKKMQVKCNVLSAEEEIFSNNCIRLDYNTCKQFLRYNNKFQYFLKIESKPMSTESEDKN